MQGLEYIKISMIVISVIAGIFLLDHWAALHFKIRVYSTHVNESKEEWSSYESWKINRDNLAKEKVELKGIAFVAKDGSKKFVENKNEELSEDINNYFKNKV